MSYTHPPFADFINPLHPSSLQF